MTYILCKIDLNTKQIKPVTTKEYVHAYLKEHTHTSPLYLYCRSCSKFIIETRDKSVVAITDNCGECGSFDTVLYRPSCCFEFYMIPIEEVPDCIIFKMSI